MYKKFTFLLFTSFLTVLLFESSVNASLIETSPDENTREQKAIASNQKVYSQDNIQEHLRKPSSVPCVCKEERFTETEGKFVHIPHFYNIELKLITTLAQYERGKEPIRILDLAPGKSSTLEAIISSAELKTKAFTYVAVTDNYDIQKSTKHAWTESDASFHKSSKLIVVDQDPFRFLKTNYKNEQSQNFDIVISFFGFSHLEPKKYIKSLMYSQNLLHDKGHLFTTQPSYEGNCYPEEYIEALMNTTKIPFWDTGKKFTSDCMTMGRLMAALGFSTIHTELSVQ